MVKIRNVSEARGRFVLGEHRKDSEILRLRETLLVVAGVGVVVVARSGGGGGGRGRMVVVVVMVVVLFGIVTGPEHVVLVELDDDVYCGVGGGGGARVFEGRMGERAQEAVAVRGFPGAEPGRAVEVHVGRPVSESDGVCCEFGASTDHDD